MICWAALEDWLKEMRLKYLNSSFFTNNFYLFTFLLCALLVVSGYSFADTLLDDGKMFSNKTSMQGINDTNVVPAINSVGAALRVILYVVAAFGMAGIAVQAFFGRFRWGLFFAWCFAVFILGAVEVIVQDLI